MSWDKIIDVAAWIILGLAVIYLIGLMISLVVNTTWNNAKSRWLTGLLLFGCLAILLWMLDTRDIKQVAQVAETQVAQVVKTEIPTVIVEEDDPTETTIDPRIATAEAVATKAANEAAVGATLTVLAPASTQTPEPTTIINLNEDDEKVDIDTTGGDEDLVYPQCPEGYQTPEQMASTIGGDAADWSTPEGTWGAWVFRSRGFETLDYPEFGFFDTPNSRFLEKEVTVQEASFHCEDPPAS